MPTPVFYVEHTDRVNIYLRRYSSMDNKCSAGRHYCNAMVFFCEAPAARDKDGYYCDLADDLAVAPLKDDPRWPAKCEACGKPFLPTDEFQLFRDTIMKALDGRTWPRRELPAGACYDAFWDKHDRGPDGRSLVVLLPTKGRLPWSIDGRASNCTKPDDKVHRCWCRHGRPEDGTLHVDKNGNTCAAGAGSIAVEGYHGFLHHGLLTDG